MLGKTRSQTRKRQLEKDYSDIDCVEHTAPKLSKMANSGMNMATGNENSNEAITVFGEGDANMAFRQAFASQSTSSSEASSRCSSEVPETPNTDILLSQKALQEEMNKIRNDMSVLMRTMGQLTKSFEALTKTSSPSLDNNQPHNTPITNPINNLPNVNNNPGTSTGQAQAWYNNTGSIIMPADGNIMCQLH
ncbi:uncharacterized protein [Musca autumnalis]|uniref:uncharacterized protein n=1 Tax=Musca autumnalis TaxID=221902 RepID=UPI003CF83040